MSTLLEGMAEWAVSLRGRDLPESVLDAARLQLTSVLASLYSGADTGPGRACKRAALALGTRGVARVLTGGEQVGPYAAVLTNAAYSMAHDFDDYLFLGHTGHSSVLAALAVAEEVDASIDDMLVAQVAANELAGRLGAFVAIGPQNGQLWAHIHIAAAAVAAARLYGLTARQAADALAIGFYQPPYSLFPGFFGSDAKVLTAAAPAAAGLYAARLAGEGMRGARDILEHGRGLGAELAFLPLPEVLAGLGRSWVSQSLSYKIYPGCAYVDGPVDAALGAMREREQGLDVAEVERVDIAATALTWAMERVGAESATSGGLEPIAINFSARHSVAIALLERGLSPRHMDPAWLAEHREAIAALVAKTTVRESRGMTAEMLQGISRAVDLPGLARTVGAGRAWASRGRLWRAGSAMTARPSRARRRGRIARAAARPGAARDALSSLAAVLRALGASRGSFDMRRANFADLEFRFGAEVTIRLSNGRVLEGGQVIPLGAAGRPYSETRELVACKLEEEAGRDRAQAIEAVLARDARTTSARELAGAVCADGFRDQDQDQD